MIDTFETVDIDAELADIARLFPGGKRGACRVEITGAPRAAHAAFDVDRLLATSAAHAVSAIDALGTQRKLDAPPRSIDLAHLLAFCTTHVEVDGEAVPAWADLSGVYPTADGRHLQIHCNFPHHADGVVRRLGCAADRESVTAAIAERDAFDLEAELIDDGMIAAVVRSLDEWSHHPHAAATADLPVVSVERLGDAPSLPVSAASPGRPLDGLRVVDCSRVLAGPVAGQVLAGVGAEVMRIGAAHLPSVPVGVMSTGFGKRNAFADVTTETGREALWELLREADVWIDAYRPGAMAAHGFTPEEVARVRPGIVIVQVCGFDWVGPWAGRRGFDSIVQSTTGIRWAGGQFAVDDDGARLDRGPIGLPVQALDYATGFLAAGAAAELVRHQRTDGGTWMARLSLLRTRNWLTTMGGPTDYTPASIAVDEDLLDSVDSDFGRIAAVRPFVGSWPSAPALLGSSAPRWV